tara:strand:+ start:390 stop:1145 length:756 start_codon:yes stop_codon:yes gene_type:complete
LILQKTKKTGEDDMAFFGKTFAGAMVLMSLAMADTAASRPAFAAPADCTCEAVDEATARRFIIRAALEHSVPPELALAVADVKSGFRSDLIGPGGEIGLMQIDAGNAEFNYGVSRFDLKHADTNADIGTRYLRYLYAVKQSWPAAVASLNTDRWSTPDTTEENRKFVSEVLRKWERYESMNEIQEEILQERELQESRRANQSQFEPSSRERSGYGQSRRDTSSFRGANISSWEAYSQAHEELKQKFSGNLD